jgi:FtsZ-binding cell division protein ZapB
MLASIVHTIPGIIPTSGIKFKKSQERVRPADTTLVDELAAIKAKFERLQDVQAQNSLEISRLKDEVIKSPKRKDDELIAMSSRVDYCTRTVQPTPDLSRNHSVISNAMSPLPAIRSDKERTDRDITLVTPTLVHGSGKLQSPTQDEPVSTKDVFEARLSRQMEEMTLLGLRLNDFMLSNACLRQELEAVSLAKEELTKEVAGLREQLHICTNDLEAISNDGLRLCYEFDQTQSKLDAAEASLSETIAKLQERERMCSDLMVHLKNSDALRLQLEADREDFTERLSRCQYKLEESESREKTQEVQLRIAQEALEETKKELEYYKNIAATRDANLLSVKDDITRIFSSIQEPLL